MRKLTCTTCNGQGYSRYNSQGYSRYRETCIDCKGHGVFYTEAPAKIVTIPHREAYLLALRGQNLLHPQN